MKKSLVRLSLAAVVMFMMIAVTTPVVSADGPQYASSKTKTVIMQMVEAHGGMKAWKSARSISYDHKMVDPRKPDAPWVSKEFHDPRTRRTYHEWPLDDAVLIKEGGKTWTVNWGKANPPSMMAGVSFFFLNLPWITQDSSVILDEPGRGKLPHDPGSKEFITVRMTFKDGNPYEYYDLYIDPDDHLLKGAHYTVTYRPLFDVFRLPPEVKKMGPLVKVYSEFKKIGGLTFAARYDTMVSRDGINYSSMGEHYATNYSLKRPFDEARMKIPSEAVWDDSDEKYAVYLAKLRKEEAEKAR